MQIYNWEEQTVVACNRLADRFATMHGHISRPEYEYFRATHPQEALFWSLAVEAFEFLKGTPVEDILAELDDEYDEWTLAGAGMEN